jgi:hypothetical protein
METPYGDTLWRHLSLEQNQKSIGQEGILARLILPERRKIKVPWKTEYNKRKRLSQKPYIYIKI